MVNIIDNLCTKKGNSSIFGPKTLGLKSRAGYNGTMWTVLSYFAKRQGYFRLREKKIRPKFPIFDSSATFGGPQ